MVEDNFEVCWNCGTAQDGVEDPEFPACLAETSENAQLDPAGIAGMKARRRFWPWFAAGATVLLIAALCIGFLLRSYRLADNAESGPRLGCGKSVSVRVGQSHISEQPRGAGDIFACLVWAERLREDLSEIQRPRVGIKRVGSKVYPANAEDLISLKTAAELPLLVVGRVDPKWSSYGEQYFSTWSSPQGGYILMDRTELGRGGEVWATYEATAEPFTESFMLDGNKRRLDAGRVFLADFTSQPVRVQQLDIGDQQLAEARDALTGNTAFLKQERRYLQLTLRQLADHNATVRQFVGGALVVPSTH
ncbi:MAG: hypothetical protein ACYC3X_31835 [Pirellulaceae bacterium]